MKAAPTQNKSRTCHTLLPQRAFLTHVLCLGMPSHLPGCRTVFVKNLPYELTEEEVREAFTFCGKIANVRLAIWNHTKAKKGFGYVDFVKEESAEIAVKKQGTIRVKGRLVAIDYESGKPKGSFRTEDGRNWKKVAGKPTK